MTAADGRPWRRAALLDWVSARGRLAYHRAPSLWRSAALRTRHRWLGADLPEPQLRCLDFSAGSVARIVIAPANFAGQAAAWARALERYDARVSAIVVEFGSGKLAFPHDLLVPGIVAAGDPRWAASWYTWVSERATHLLAEAGRPIFGQRWGHDLGRELASLVRRRVGVAVIAHGTDIRVPSEHARQEPWSPFRDSHPENRLMEYRARATLDTLMRLDVPRFVSTPDLIDLLPGARWCPVVVDVAKWQLPASSASDGPLRVLHVPSNERIKGSALVESTLQRLDRSGLIQYTRATAVPAAQMPQLYGVADVVIDQFRIGNYGVAACEAMAAERVVVSHVSDAVRERVRRETGLSLPIIEATPPDLAVVLKELAADPQRRSALGAEGRVFVSQVHDGRRSAAVLQDWLQVTDVQR